MSNEKDSSNSPLSTARGIYFAFVAQLEEQQQMDVVRWLRSDPRYRVCTIVHDRDVVTAEEATDERKEGELKKAHVHGLLKLSSKITASSLCKRFGGYLHFELLHDPQEYAMYMLHKTFNAQSKAQYERFELLDDVALWDEITHVRQSDDLAAIVSDIADTMKNGEIDVARLIADGNIPALKSLMAHSYFYATFIQKKSRKGGE